MPIPTHVPPDEAARIAALRRLQILGTPHEERFDRLARLVARVLDVPIAFISFVEAGWQWHQATVGLDAAQTAHTLSFCTRTLDGGDLFIVPDATTDPQFADNDLVAGAAGIRSYAGVPLTAADGRKIGMLAVMDARPRQFAAADVQVLHDFAVIAGDKMNVLTTEQTLRELADAREQLAVERAKFEAFMNWSPCVIFMKDRESRNVFMNRRGEELFGSTDYKMRSDAEWLPAEVARKLRENDGRVWESGEPLQDIEVVPTPNGDPRYWLVMKFLVPAGVGEQWLLGGVAIDVTAQRKAETRLRAIADNVPALIAYIDAEQRFRFVNESYRTWFGLDPEAMIGRTATEVFGSVIDAKSRSRMAAVMGGEHVRFEGEILVGGRERFLEASYVPDRDENGVVRGFYVTVNDLTSRQRFEQALQDLASLQDAILDNANFAIMTTDARGVFRTFNSTAERWSGYRAEELVGHATPALFFDPEEVAALRARLELKLGRPIATMIDWVDALIGDSGRTHDEREWTWVRKDGTRFPISLSLTALRNAEGRPTGTLGVGRDITAEKAAETAKHQAQETVVQAKLAAEQSSRAKSQFLANMSHEVRTPLHGILGVTGMLLETPLSAEQRSLAETVHGSAQSLLSVVNSVLDFSRIESGKLVLNPSDFILAELIGELIRLHAFRASEKGIALDWMIAPELPGRVRGDADRLRQVLHNLLGNAIKFSARGIVHLRVEPVPRPGPAAAPDDDRWRLRFSVRDEGIGIAAEAQERIFEAFAQADDSMARRFGGSGLGLAIARQLVELMGGEMGVESAAGAGSTFWFTAIFSPAQALAVMPPLARRKELLRPVFAPRCLRVLLAEDSEISRVVAEHQLRQLGCSVTVVSDGLAAIAAADPAAGGDFDLVLMDCQMPVKDGYSAATEIRLREAGTGRRTCIVAQTANVLQGERERCLAAGMDDYLSKPYRPAQLAAVVRAAACLVRDLSNADSGISEARLAEFRAVSPDGGVPLVERLVCIFRREAPESLAAIQEAAAFDNAETLEAAAHKLKGSAGNFGARRLQRMCLAIEELCREDMARFARSLLPELEDELSAVLELLERKD